ncbi:hypothetical protein Aperf_G00000077717 [Anoplocephala perfoliata]
MPVLDRSCIKWAVVAALGLNCRINTTSRFDRKHYFYSDSPAGFQITQHDLPIAEDGWLDYIWKSSDPKAVPQMDKAKIRRIQLEQDTGKSLHDEKTSRSLIDLNRAGVALIEIVTDPVFTASCQAAAFVDELACLLRHLQVCSSNMSTGEMRVDINVSIGSSISQQGPVVEIKNVNSLRAIRHAIDYEVHRQRKVFQAGGKVINETRSFDLVTNKTIAMRDKEVVQDYRFLPEPNLPPLRLLESCQNCSQMKHSKLKTVCISCVREQHKADFAQLPNKLREKLVFQHGLPLERAGSLIDNPRLLSLYFSTAKLTMDGDESVKKDILAVQDINENDFHSLVYRETSFWCSGLLLSNLRNNPHLYLPTAEQLSQFVIMNLTGEIFGLGSEQVLNEMCAVGGSANAQKIADRLGVLLINDLFAIQTICEEFVKVNPTLIEKYARKGRKHRHLVSMVQYIICNNVQHQRRLHEALVERCLSDLLNHKGLLLASQQSYLE